MEGNLASLRGIQVRIDDINVILDKLLMHKSTMNMNLSSIVNVSCCRVIRSARRALAVGRDRCEEIRAMVVWRRCLRDIIGIDGDQYLFTDEAYPLPILHV